VLIFDDRARRFIVEEQAAGQGLFIRRDDAGVVKLRHRSQVPLVVIARPQVQAPWDQKDVLAGRGYRETSVAEGEEIDVAPTMTWRYGDVFFQIAWAES